MSLFGVELNSQVNRILQQIRLQLQLSKLTPNLRTIYVSCSQFDREMKGRISLKQFQKAMNQNGIFLKQWEWQVLEKAYSDHDGGILWRNIGKDLKVQINSIRSKVINQIYDDIQKTYPNATTSELKNLINPKGVYSFKQGKIIYEKASIQFLQLLPSPLSRDEFASFYDDLSLNFPSDEQFIRFVSEQWNHQTQNNKIVNEQVLRSTIKAFRYKLIQKTQGTSQQFLLKKIFSQYENQGKIDQEGLDGMLKRMQLPQDRQVVFALKSKLDKNKSGFIEYDEFKRFLFFDPFPA